MPSRNPKDLHPDLLPLYEQFMEGCTEIGLDILTTCTYRSNAEQDELYAQGRTKPGPIVTKAKGGQSEHNFMLNGVPAAKAFDIVPLRNGKPVWGTHGNDFELWKSAGNIGEALGLNWYGNPSAKFREFPHFALKD